MAKVLPRNMFNAFIQVNSQQMLMNFDTFPSYSRVNCMIRINFNLNAVHAGLKFYNVNDLNPSEFHAGYIPRNPGKCNTLRMYSL